MTTPVSPTEAWFDSYGVTKRELRAIPLDRIDEQTSRRNQARLSSAAVSEEVALNYALALENGDVFPPIVVTEGTTGYVILDGNHRHAAHQMTGRTTIDAWVVSDITNAQKQLLTFDANTRHGMATSVNDRVQQAATLVNAGVSVTNAARALNVPTPRVSGVLAAQEAEKQLANAGVDTSHLSNSHFTRLAALRSHPVRIAAANWFNEQRVHSIEASGLINQIRHLPSERDQLDFIRRESGRRAALNTATARGRITLPTPIVHLQKALTDIDKINTDLAADTMNDRMTNELKTVLASRTLDAISKLRRIAAKLQE